MAPKSPWKKNIRGSATTSVQNQQRNDASGQLAINYVEVQGDEIEALKAIYMDDYEEVETKTAWSKTTDRSFRLILRAFSDTESTVTLDVRLTATYPRTVPLLDVQGLKKYHDRTQARIKSILQTKPRALLGEVMIHEIASAITEALEDAVQARQQGTLPSLEYERATAEENALEVAKQLEQAQVQRQLEAQEEEDRVLKQMVDDEIQRREKRKSVKLPSTQQSEQSTNPAIEEVLYFEQPARVQIGSDTVSFSSVTVLEDLQRARGHRICTARANVVEPVKLSPTYVRLEQLEVDLSREQELDLERFLETVKALRRHQGILSLLAFKIESISLAETSTRLTLCSERAGQSLAEVLESGLWLTKARQFMIELLEAIEFLHTAGLCHGSLSADSIFIVGQPPQPKIGNIGKNLYAPMNASHAKDDARSGGPSAKADIRALGVVFAQMLLGLHVIGKHGGAASILEHFRLSEPCEDFLGRMVHVDSKRRPSAFDLLNAEFLRTDAPVMETPTPYTNSVRFRSRHNSSNVMESASSSRYATDFTEISRIGKGGFGEVVKARNKLDGGIYAIKKIRQAPQLDKILSEVKLLNRLNHPYVVRYFSTWTEVEATSDGTRNSMSETTTTETQTTGQIGTEEDSDTSEVGFGYQSGGLDFVSSSGHIQFGEDEEESENDSSPDSYEQAIQFGEEGASSAVESAENSQDANHLRKQRSDSRKLPTTLYIQMEYCERQTLRDLIRKSLSTDDAWRYARQITEGLANIHGHGVIHRDLKPDNVFIDLAGNPKIGDFGLATTNQYYNPDKATSRVTSGDMTRSIGTALYVAPELRSGGSTTYTNKVDMYSLGIMFYEMCETWATTMERIRAIQAVRERDFSLPQIFLATHEKAAQGRLISCLISHKPSERPSSAELLRSDILPVKIEDETIRHFIDGLSDQHSPYHQKLMSVLFAHDATKRVKALAWDAQNKNTAANAVASGTSEYVRSTLITMFKRHGATMAQRQALFPRSSYYHGPNVVQLLDVYGNLLQLPYDLTLAHAREIANDASASASRTFTFGSVYRDTLTGGVPRAIEEVDFDIVGSSDRPKLVDDAEILAVVNDVVDGLPSLARHNICFLINHVDILDAILEHCRVPSAQQAAVKEAISKLGFQKWTWTKIRKELASPVYALSSTTLDDLQQFDFRDSVEKALVKLAGLLRGSQKAEGGMSYLGRLIEVATGFGIARKIYVAPLSSFNAKFYEGNMLFQCAVEHKQSRDVLAAGGRYNSLIENLQPRNSLYKTPGAVGVAFALDRILDSLVRKLSSSTKSLSRDGKSSSPDSTPKSADVLLVVRDFDSLLPAAQRIARSLWDKHLSVVMSSSDKDANAFEFLVTLKHEASTTVRVKANGGNAEEEDMLVSALPTFLLDRQRERDLTRFRPPTLHRQASQSEGELKGNVNVLMAQHRSKKTNKYQIVEAAQASWAALLHGAENAPLLALETRDDVVELLRYTRLGDPESWRKAIQSVQLNERQYLQQVQGILSQWRKDAEAGETSKRVGIFNFRSGNCIAYDVDL